MKISLSDHFTYKKLLRYVMPSVFMMIVSSVYSIVDGFFVSNFVGKNSFAAVNLIMPFIMILCAVGFMIGAGGTALIAKTLGEGKDRQASEYFSMLIYVLIVLGIVLSVFGIIFMRPIAHFLGADAEVLEDCVLYGRILMASNTFFMMQNAFQSFMVAAEKPHFGLVISIATGVTNMALDFLLVYVFPFGIAGAGIATLIGQILGGMIPLVYFMRPDNNSRLRLVRTGIDWKALGKACMNGASEMVSNISASVIGMLYNFQLLRIASVNGVAAYGVIMYVTFIFMAFFFGYSVGVNPLVGYNYGAGNHGELKNILKMSLKITTVVAVIMAVAACVCAGPIASIYVGYDQELHEMTIHAMRIYSISFLLCGFNIFGSAFFTGLNNGTVSAIISFLRTFVFQVATILILPIFLGVNGIWLAITVAEGLTLVVTMYFLVKNRHRYHYAD